MEKYISKDALVAEIEKLSAYLDGFHEQRIIEKILSSLDTLEEKEVDFAKEFYTFSDKHKLMDKDIEFADIEKTASFFFQLGLKASNPITAADRGTAEEIIINLKRVEKDYRIDLTREIEWLSNKVKKVE